MRHTQTVRPYFDVVEEYTRSLEEYRERTHPTDEQMGECIPNGAYKNYGPQAQVPAGRFEDGSVNTSSACWCVMGGRRGGGAAHRRLPARVRDAEA